LTTGIHVVFKRIKLIFRLEFEEIFIPQQPVEVQTDPSKYAFGKFFVSDQAAKWMRGFPEFRFALDASKDPHDRLHESALASEEMNAQAETMKSFAGELVVMVGGSGI